LCAKFFGRMGSRPVANKKIRRKTNWEGPMEKKKQNPTGGSSSIQRITPGGGGGAFWEHQIESHPKKKRPNRSLGKTGSQNIRQTDVLGKEKMEEGSWVNSYSVGDQIGLVTRSGQNKPLTAELGQEKKKGKHFCKTRVAHCQKS